jgi:hypothetical protein
MQFTTHAAGLLSRLPSYLLVGFVAGGALRSHFDGTELKDIDIFFRSEEDYYRAVDAASCDTSLRWLGAAGRTHYYEASDGVQINLVGFAFGSPQETIERFDFRCCRMAAWLKAPGVYAYAMDDHAAVDATLKRLVVLQNNGEERTVQRIQHYVHDYGYRLDLSVVGHLIPEEDQVEHQDPQRPVAVTEVQRYLRRVPRTSGGGY